MTRRPQVSVIGYDSKVCTDEAYEAAYRVGTFLAKNGATLVTGGLGGVMEAASKGAHELRGLVVGIVPPDDATVANRYCDVVIPSGMGFARNFLVVNSADAVIIVGGGAGTLTEAAAAYGKGKFLVAVRGTGGVADGWAGRYFDERKTVRVSGADTPKEAVAMALRAVKKKAKVASNEYGT
jgi:uncharacterized protein (TIGR00725 family)